MRWRWVIFFLLTIWGGADCLSATQSGWMVAEKAYQAGTYDLAEQRYASLLKHYPSNVSLLYNLGNIAYRRGEVGKAVWYFSKAQLFSPRDLDIRHNLRLARSRVIDDVSGGHFSLSQFILGGLSFVTLKEVLLVFLGFLTLTNIWTIFLLWRRIQLRGGSRWLFTICLGFCFISFSAFSIKYADTRLSKKAIITAKKIDVKSAPFDALPTLFYLHEGVAVRTTRTLPGWAEIRLQNGFTGWIRTRDFASLD